MRKQIIVSIVMAVFLVIGVALSSFAQTTDNKAVLSDEKGNTRQQEISKEQYLLNFVNRIRTQKTQLVLNDSLNRSAQIRAEEMAEAHEISHKRPNGELFDTVITLQGIRGENVYSGGPFQDEIMVPQMAFNGWCDSTEHHKNMLDEKWKCMGAGFALGDDNKWYVCQLFSSSDTPKDDQNTGSSTEKPEPSDSTEETNKPPVQTSKPEEDNGEPEDLDPNALIQKFEAPASVVAGETIEIKATLNPEKKFVSYNWSYPGKYYKRTSESADKRTFYLQTKSADTIEIKLTVVASDGKSATASKKIEVSNSFPATITGPDEVNPDTRATFRLEVDEAATRDNIKWSVIPGICSLDFSADKREVELVTPYSGQVELTAKIELDGKIATVKKKFKVVTAFPVTLETASSAQVGKQLVVKANFDGDVSPLDIDWAMYPGTCDAWFSSDARTMYFTPTDTETLLIKVKVKKDGAYGTAEINVPVSPAAKETPAPAKTVAPTATPRPVTIGPTTNDGSPTGTQKPITIQPSATSTSVVVGPGQTTVTGPIATHTPEPADTPAPARTPRPVDISPAGSAGSSTITTAEPTRVVSMPTSAPTVTVSSGSPTSAPTKVPGEVMSEMQPRSGSDLELRAVGSGEFVLCGIEIGKDKASYTIADIISGLEIKQNMRFKVTDAKGKTCHPNTKAATGQTVGIYDQQGDLIQEATVVIPGDVLGTGTMDVAQIYRLAQAVSGTKPLTGHFLEAAKMTEQGIGTGNPDITDLIRIAEMLL